MPNSSELDRFRRAPAARPKKAGTATAVYVPSTRALHVLNPTAQLLYEYLDEPATFDELARMLEEATGGDRETIRGDLAGVLDEFTTAGLLERL